MIRKESLGFPTNAGRSFPIGATVSGVRVFHLISNAYWEALSFELPKLSDDAGKGWRRLIDTALPAPTDISTEDQAVLLEEQPYLAQPRSVVLLFSNINQSCLGAKRL